MKEYIFKINEVSNTGYIVNKETGADAGISNSQDEAAGQILDMLKDKALSPENANNIFHDVIESNLPLTLKKGGDPLKLKQGAILVLMLVRMKIEEMIREKNFEGRVVLYICERCSDHGRIYCNGKHTQEIHSKAEGRAFIQKLYDDENMNLIEKEQLEDELEKSTLPEISNDQAAAFN